MTAHIVPLTSTLRAFASEVRIEFERALSTSRVEKVRGNVGAVTLMQIRVVVGVILDAP